MAIWKEGEYMSWYAELGDGLNLGVFYNPRKPNPDQRPYEVRVFRYHTTRAATREEAQQAAEMIAREVLLQALAALDAKDDGKGVER